MTYQEADIPRLKEILFGLVPTNGGTRGNLSLIPDFVKAAINNNITTITESDYWTIRDQLIDDRSILIGRGKGGSVRRSFADTANSEPLQNTPPQDPNPTPPQSKESDLYEPFLKTINQYFVSDYRIKLFISEVTAQQGSKATGGKWTRPDVTLVAVRMHEFIPGKSVEVITFEIKPKWSINIEGVFEASSHSAFANKSFLAIHLPENIPDAILDRIERECKRFGTGLILFDNADDWSTFEVKVDAKLHTPAPEDTDDFIGTQISSENRDKLRAWVR